MEQLICHCIGDYLFQTDNQALTKKKKGKEGLFACLRHCITYTLPFLFLQVASLKACLVIFISHLIIDRTDIVLHFLVWKNSAQTKDNFGSNADRPFVITFWLYVITDNVFHIICNYLAIKYL